MDNLQGLMMATVATADIDMSGDVMNVNGCDSTLIEDCGTFLNEHDVEQTIGKCLKIIKGNNNIMAKLQFAIDADKESELYKRAFNVLEEYKTGVRNKFSIGFIPTEVSTNPKVCSKYGEACKRYISKWLLVEVSAVTLPDNFSTKVIDLKSIYGDKLETKRIGDKKIEYKTIDIKSLSGPDNDNNMAQCEAENKPVESMMSQVCISEVETKPYENEIAARMEDPSKFTKFRRDNNAGGEGVDFIFGITEDGKAELQSIRFDASKFTDEQAHNWLKEHDKTPIEFSPAKKEEKDETIQSNDQPADIPADQPSIEEAKLETKKLPEYKPVIEYRCPVNVISLEQKRAKGKIVLK